MTKQDIINQIGQCTGLNPLTGRAVIETFFQLVKQHLATGESVTVRGFGTFETTWREARIARNINQNTAHPIAAHRVPIFKPSAEFKQQVRERTDIDLDK